MSKLGFLKDAIILFVITLVAGACLGGVHGITEEPIRLAQEAAKKAAYREVFSDAADFPEGDYAAAVEKANTDIAGLDFGNVTVDECVSAVDASGSLIGYVVTATSKDGYGGAVTVSVGITTGGEIKGIAFLTLNETPGLGMKAKDADFYGQFAGKTAEKLSVVSHGMASADSDVDAISGATITSRAVTGAVNGSLYFVHSCLGE